MPITITVIVMPAFSQIFSGFAGDPQRTPSHMDRRHFRPQKNGQIVTNRERARASVTIKIGASVKGFQGSHRGGGMSWQIGGLLLKQQDNQESSRLKSSEGVTRQWWVTGLPTLPTAPTSSLRWTIVPISWGDNIATPDYFLLQSHTTSWSF